MSGRTGTLCTLAGCFPYRQRAEKPVVPPTLPPFNGFPGKVGDRRTFIGQGPFGPEPITYEVTATGAFSIDPSELRRMTPQAARAFIAQHGGRLLNGRLLIDSFMPAQDVGTGLVATPPASSYLNGLTATLPWIGAAAGAAYLAYLGYQACYGPPNQPEPAAITAIPSGYRLVNGNLYADRPTEV
jgi:hypothetical protein